MSDYYLKYTNVEIDGKLDAVTRRNLIDNWYFGNPVNQRGWVAYGGNAGYTADRWYRQSGTVYLGSGVMAITEMNGVSVMQKIANPSIFAGKTLTLSVLGYASGSGAYVTVAQDGNFKSELNLYLSGTLDCKSVTFSAEANLSNDLSILFADWTASDTAYLLAVKLELGDTQTLAHQENGVWVLNEIPDYGEELIKCQRYFQTYRTQSLRPTYAADCRPVMRTDPAQSTISIDGTTYYTNSAEL